MKAAKGRRVHSFNSAQLDLNRKVEGAVLRSVFATLAQIHPAAEHAIG